MPKILFILLISTAFGFAPPDTAGFKCQITREHQMVPTYDTVMVTHFHKVGDRFYVILKDGRDLWVDDCLKLTN